MSLGNRTSDQLERNEGYKAQTAPEIIDGLYTGGALIC